MMDYSHFKTFEVRMLAPGVLGVAMNRPRKRNAQNRLMWVETGQLFSLISSDSDVRVVVLSGNGKAFTAGLDISALADTGSELSGGDEEIDVARKGLRIEPGIALPQESFTAIEKCRVPVIAAIHGACIGAGIDMSTACDVRYCSQDAYFSIREVAVGLAADVGTLQRLPKVVGNDSFVRELAYTARDFTSAEAKEFGLVSRVFNTREEMFGAALALAKSIAAMSPIAVAATKRSLVFSRDNPVSVGLEHVRVLNMLNLQSDDLTKSAMAAFSKEKPTFSKL